MFTIFHLGLYSEKVFPYTKEYNYQNALYY